MTALVGRKGDKDPGTCSVCGRRAGNYGICAKNSQHIAWVCDEPSCVKAGAEIYKMTLKQLDVFEKRAIEAAAADVADALTEAVLEALYEKGVRNLDDLDGPKFKDVATALGKSPGLTSALTNALGKFGEVVRHEALHGVPF